MNKLRVIGVDTSPAHVIAQIWYGKKRGFPSLHLEPFSNSHINDLCNKYLSICANIPP